MFRAGNLNDEKVFLFVAREFENDFFIALCISPEANHLW